MDTEQFKQLKSEIGDTTIAIGVNNALTDTVIERLDTVIELLRNLDRRL